MKYILDQRYRLRGWHGSPYGLYDTKTGEVLFLPEAFYHILMLCDAVQETDAEFLSPEERSFLLNLQEEKIIQPAGRWDFLTEKQRYHAYPARYRKNAHWSLTGACNMRCRHCFMSAPQKNTACRS